MFSLRDLRRWHQQCRKVLMLVFWLIVRGIRRARFDCPNVVIVYSLSSSQSTILPYFYFILFLIWEKGGGSWWSRWREWRRRSSLRRLNAEFLSVERSLRVGWRKPHSLCISSRRPKSCSFVRRVVSSAFASSSASWSALLKTASPFQWRIITFYYHNSTDLTSNWSWQLPFIRYSIDLVLELNWTTLLPQKKKKKEEKIRKYWQ